MTRMIQCKKLKKEAEGFERAPYPGPLGQKIFEEISQEAWQLWLNQQTMLINEYRLSMLDPNARKFLVDEMERFLFGDGSAKPAGYIPPRTSE
jgi:Fe-S cluster biosynthesis and repair protein YggX